MQPEPRDSRLLLRQGERYRPCGDCGQVRFIQAHGLCRRCYKAWKRASDPDYAERDRRSAVRWKERNREANRARDRARLVERRDPCPACGSLKRHESEKCRDCIAQAAEDRKQRIVAMWQAGASLREIASALGSTKGSVQAEISKMRAAGMEVPYRHRGYGQVAA